MWSLIKPRVKTVKENAYTASNLLPKASLDSSFVLYSSLAPKFQYNGLNTTKNIDVWIFLELKSMSLASSQ
ncbi:hypothetical protein OGATHE_001643 [Ogataea polymorpha]|uniref:Uncharacterized protein n=1 Tax=Ogataea polymorpha TaxID=460523 RepID=A0A9P8TDB8_9ASCO|nr:hypothetical protein OGATHE_001643 [Ogataea polymorpha]